MNIIILVSRHLNFTFLVPGYEAIHCICSPGALNIKGTASGIYPIPPGYQGLLPGGYIQRFAGRLSEENRQGIPCGFVSTLHITMVYTVHMYHKVHPVCFLLTTYLQSAVYRPGNAGKKGGETTPIPPRTVKKRRGGGFTTR